MNCIICDKIANEVGSHVIPASLIKNCVGTHYREESFNFDSKNAKINVYYGRDNLRNTSTEIKQNHYKRDNILCKACENKLGLLEAKFSSEFLQKFRVEKFKANFIIQNSNTGYEIYEPQRLTNEETLAYFYSIVFRFCKVYYIEDGDSYLTSSDLLKVKKFLLGFLYNSEDLNYKKEIEGFNILINFNKYSTDGTFIATSNSFRKPYIFYFCEAIIVLYTEELENEDKQLFDEVLSRIEHSTTKIVVGPESLYNNLSKQMANILANEFITNGVKYISKLNGKSYKTNLDEVSSLIQQYEKQKEDLYLGKIFDDLKNKYSS